MNKTELVNAVAAKGLSKKDADVAVKAVLDSITEALKKGEKVQLIGFGTFEVRERAEKEAIESARRARQEKEERKAQYKRRKEPLKRTLDEVRSELNKTFLTPKRKAELKEQEAVLEKNIKELDMLFPDIWD